MKAAVCYQFQSPLVIEQLSIEPPSQNEILVNIKACAICHSDIAYMQGEWGGNLPVVLGHEASGIVEACGEGVSHVKKGDRVLVTLLRNCGACYYCQQGQSFICSSQHVLDNKSLHNDKGEAISRGLKTAAFAEKVVVDSSQIIAIPDELEFAPASLLSCGVLTGFGAVVNVACPQAGQSAVVIGAGGVGLNAIQALRISGAHPIIAIDLLDSKLRVAEKFGATHGINGGSSDVREVVLDITGGRLADFVFVAAGGSGAVQSGFPLLGLGGVFVIVGMTRNGDFSQFDSTDIANGNKRIFGSKMGSSRLAVDIPRLLGLYGSGDLLLDELISGEFGLDDINVAVGEVMGDKALRHVIRF